MTENTGSLLEKQPTDDDLLTLLRDPLQQEAGFRKLMSTYQERLYHMVYRMTTSQADTEDILQEIFLKVFLKLPGFSGRSSLYTWVYRIAVNETLNLLERRQREQKRRSEPVATSPDRSPGPSADQVQQLLLQALATLPPRQRLVFDLRYHEELDYREMSRLLDTSEGALKASYHHAVQKIRLCLQKHAADV